MRYLALLIPLLFSGCTSVQYIKTHDNRLVTQDNESVNIVGDPLLACHLTGFNKIYTGYFMYQDDAGTIFLDDYGRGTIELQGDVTCQLTDETK